MKHHEVRQKYSQKYSAACRIKSDDETLRVMLGILNWIWGPLLLQKSPHPPH